ncbi:MAG: hypothetical protein IJA72_02140, partial [Clostridia bacterium]|nr:hypothetical protein [Clostridia bacterium]
VKVEYYTTNKDGVEDTEDDNVIYLATKYFVYEIAVYTPARELSVTTDKDSIIYINNDYLEAATANFGVKLNIPTKELIFSSSVINDVINKASDGTTKAIYAVKVESADLSAEWANGYFEVLGLNNGYVSLSKLNTDETFTFMAKKSLEDLTTDGKYSVSFDVVIEQFGQKSSYSLTKVIMFGDYEKSEALLVGGVDAYSNLYLSMANPDAETNVGEVTVKVSNSTATFKDVGYNIYLIKNNATTNKETETKYTGVDFKVEAIEGTNKFKVIADGEFGGVYRVEFYAKDSYNGTKYTVTSSIRVTVSDGKTAETAYLIGTLTEFKALHSNTTNQYYRLSNDINISGLSSDWWSVNRVFAGTLDGASTITNPNTGETISKCYRLIGLTINSDSRVAGAFALFASNTGTIKNVILNEVTYDIILDGDNTSSDVVAIGTIAGTNNGTIENCSITFKKSTVKFANSALNRVYNIGLLAGINNNTIKYNNTQINSEYSYMVDFENGGRFVVELAEGSTNLNSSNIYIGGLVGQNSGGATISATYQDNSDQAIRTLITAVVDMEFKSNYSNANAPITVNTAFGGIVGLNNGTIQNVAISGSLKANDKINMGGIAGENNANIIEVANYGACIEGNVFIDGYSFSYDGTTKTNIYHGYSKQSLENQAKTVNLEQNIGGIIGFNNAGTVDKVRTMFITFDSAEVSIMPQLTYIKGVGNIGGIIGKATDTQLTRAYVENFISESIKDVEVRGQEDEELADEYKKYLIELIAENSNIIGNSANVGGLIACVNDSGSGEETAIDVAFVQANFMINSGAFAEFGAPYNYVYFIGDVYGGTAVSGLLENAYIVHNDISIDETIIEKPVLKIVLSNTTLPTVLTGTADINGIKVGWRQAEDVNNGYPYLIYVEDGEEIKTLTVVPKEIIVKVDNEYFGVVYQKLDTEPSDWETAWTNYYKFENEAYVKLTDTSAPEFSATVYYSKIEPTSPSFEKWGEGLYIQYADDTNSHGFSATAIVYYYDNADNVHKLVTDNSGKGLVEKAILPSIASGIYSVSIVSGEDKAVIQGADAIKFIDTGVVELRFASAFDRTIQDVVTIFIENPLTDEVFDISAGSGLSDVNNMGNNFSTSAGQNALLDVTLQKEDGQIEFNTDNTYMLLTVTSATANKTGETPSVITDY